MNETTRGMSAHTPGPLRSQGRAVVGRNYRVALCDGPGGIGADDAARIVACWNACEGIADPASALLEARSMLAFALVNGVCANHRSVADALRLIGGKPEHAGACAESGLRAQCDELLAALRWYADRENYTSGALNVSIDNGTRARAALAKAVQP